MSMRKHSSVLCFALSFAAETASLEMLFRRKIQVSVVFFNSRFSATILMADNHNPSHLFVDNDVILKSHHSSQVFSVYYLGLFIFGASVMSAVP